MPRHPPHELVRGEVIGLEYADFRHGHVLSRVLFLLQSAGPDLAGLKVVGPCGFHIERDPDTVRAPDAAAIRAPRLEGLDPWGWPPFAPDVAIEVAGWGEAFAWLEGKIRMWLDLGTEAVWVVEPKTRRVFVYRARAPREDLSGDDVLTGGELFPAFSVPIDRIFKEVAE